MNRENMMEASRTTHAEAMARIEAWFAAAGALEQPGFHGKRNDFHAAPVRRRTAPRLVHSRLSGEFLGGCHGSKSIGKPSSQTGICPIVTMKDHSLVSWAGA